MRIPETFKAWSYSRLSCYDKCPLQAKLKFLVKIPEPPAPALEKGKAAHEILARFMAGFAEDRRDIPGYEHFGPLMVELRAMEPLVEQQWGFTDEWLPTDWFGHDTWFRAVLDVATVYADNTADVVDFKTGKASPGHEDQAELYAVSIFQRYSEVQEINVRFWYLDLGTESVYTYTRDELKMLKVEWERKAEPMMADTTFTPRPGHHCNWCSYAESKLGPCDFG